MAQFFKHRERKRRNQQGQALVELLPSLMVFLTILVAGLSYFQVMREASVRQEVVRNLAFAKIENSGTLTTPPNHLVDAQASIALAAPALSPIEEGASILLGEHAFVGCADQSISIYPQEPRVNVPIYLLQAFGGSGRLPVININTFSFLFREAGDECQ